MIVHSYYEEDARVRREAETLVGAGWSVDVFGLRRPGDSPASMIGGVNLLRLPVKRHQGAGLPVYLAEYGNFLARALWAAARAHRHRRYGLIQVHSLPDYLVFAALPLKMLGVPVLLDLHEAMPEFFRSRFPKAANPFSYRMLRLQERMSTGFATELLTVNESLAERLRTLGTRPEKLTVILNSPDLTIFDPTAHPRRAFMADGVLRIVYTGAITPTYELDVVLGAVAALRRLRPKLRVEAALYGRGDDEERLRALAAELGISAIVSLPGRVPIEQVPAVVAASDIGVAPTRLDPFTEMSLSTKILEYAALGKPVVASRLPTVERYFTPDTLALYESGDPESLAARILGLVDDPADRGGRVQRTGSRVDELSWTHQAESYLAVVDRLVARGAARRRHRQSEP
jgi:glycosyltransferase involved in cell wall biosynthesis